jgi:large subunit ribosomal protein L10
MKSSLIFLGVVTSAAAFAPAPQQPTTTALFGGGRGEATTLAGKQQTVAHVKELLDKSEMIITVPAGGITVTQAQKLRQSLPEGTTAKVVKNKLMARAIEGTTWEAVGDQFLKGSNMWFFIEEDIGGTVKSWNAFLKDVGLKDSLGINGGNIEGTNYDDKGVDAISKLPSKLELIARVAGGIKAVPTKLARVTNAPGTKLARAIKLAGEKVNE